MFATINLRNRSYNLVTLPQLDHRIIELTDAFRGYIIEQVAITMALAIAGADPIEVTQEDTPFMRAARDLVDIYIYGNGYYSIDPRPIFMKDGIALTAIRQNDHCTDIRIYRKNRPFKLISL